jgi:hypothetical protein
MASVSVYHLLLTVVVGVQQQEVLGLATVAETATKDRALARIFVMVILFCLLRDLRPSL